MTDNNTSIGGFSDSRFETDADRVKAYFTDRKKPSKKQSPSNSLTEAVINYVRLNGGSARRVNTTGVYVEAKYNERGVQLKGTGKYRTSGMRKGFEDISCIMPPNGRYLAVEVKIGYDKLSEDQIERKEEVEKCGGIYYVAKDFDSFKLFYDTMTATRTITDTDQTFKRPLGEQDGCY